MNKVNKLNTLGLWLQFTFGAEEIVFGDEADTVSFKYNNEIRVLPIQWLDTSTVGFLANKEMFNSQGLVQITRDYLAVINTDDLRKHLKKFSKHITKRDDGNVEYPREIVDGVVRIIYYEDLDGVQKNKG